MADLSLKTETFGSEDHSWLGSARGTQSTQSITLQVSAFTANTHYPSGYFPSGLPLGKYTSGGNAGKYGPYTQGASDGTQNLAGFLFTSQRVVSPITGTAATVVVGALLETGRVIVSKLPISIDGTAQATNPRFVYA